MKFVGYWKRNLKYYVKRSFIENGLTDVDLIAKDIVGYFQDKYITKYDRKLLDLVQKKDVSQSDFDNFIRSWDIEQQGGHKALMLSYFMKLHPELSYPGYVEPRLNGVLRYYRFKNLNLISHFKKICTKIKKAGIDILIIKGGALRYYNSEVPRIMGDIDILVAEKDYEAAKNIASGLGYTYKEYPHSADFFDPKTDLSVLDIHNKLDIAGKKDFQITPELFKRASKENVYGVDGVYVPSLEDMMFITLINLAKNMMRNTSFPSILYSILDCKYLIEAKKDFDWNIVRQNAINTKSEPQIYIAIEFINGFISTNLPILFEKEFHDRSILYLYNKWFLKKMQEQSHTYSIKDIFNSGWKSIKSYMSFRPQYILYKRKTIRTNPQLAKKVLENQKLVEKC